MKILRDRFHRSIRLTDERLDHLLDFHPEMANQLRRIRATLSSPTYVVQSSNDIAAELFYKFYNTSPVGAKYLCVIVKAIGDDYFVLTAYFTDKIKRGELIWTEANE